MRRDPLAFMTELASVMAVWGNPAASPAERSQADKEMIRMLRQMADELEASL